MKRIRYPFDHRERIARNGRDACELFEDEQNSLYECLMIDEFCSFGLVIDIAIFLAGGLEIGEAFFMLFHTVFQKSELPHYHSDISIFDSCTRQIIIFNKLGAQVFLAHPRFLINFYAEAPGHPKEKLFLVPSHFPFRVQLFLLNLFLGLEIGFVEVVISLNFLENNIENLGDDGFADLSVDYRFHFCQSWHFPRIS